MGNVLINGRTSVHAGSAGTLTTIDVCWTKVGKPVVRIPYTNIAKSSDAAGTAGSVLINGNPVCNKASIFAVSTGDEPGDRLGVKSGTIKGKAEFITSSANVFIEGIPAERQGDLMVSNNRNTPPMPLMQPGGPPPASLQTAVAHSLTQSPTPFKIAVEVAGGKSHNMKGTLLASSSQVAREIPVGSIARAGGHRRELIIEDLPEGSYDLALRFSDERHDFCQIPLSRQIPTFAKDKESAGWDTILVPIIPRCYLEVQPDRLETTYPRSDMETRTGWLYIYLNGHIWRELQVLPEGGVKDVNLTYEKGRNQRAATATGDYVVVLPYNINGKKPLLEMCYSEVQWDWSRIDALGGMAEDDPRQRHGTAVPAGGNSEASSQLRGQRMQRIDLSEYPKFTRTEGPVGAADEFHFALRKRKHLRSWHDSGLPVVYLHDPIGVAKTLATELYACKLRYLNGRDQAAEAAGSKCAMAEMIFQMGLGSPKVAEQVAMDELRDLLKWDRQIEHLHALEEAAVTLGKYITQAPQQGVPDVHVAMKDYAEHATFESLLQGQLLSSELIGHLIYGEGRQYLAKSLNQPDHFLVGALNPSPKKLESLAKDVNKVSEFFENMAAATQVDSELRKQVFELLAKLVEQISDGEFSLANGQFDLAPVLAGSLAATAKGGYLNSSFTAMLRARLDVTQWVVIAKGMSGQMEMTLGKSVEWLQKNHPLVKLNAIRLFGVLEVMNLGNALRGAKQTGSGKEFARAAGASLALTSLGFTYLKDVNNIGAGWDNKALPKWQQYTLKLKRIKIAGGAHGAGFIGNVIVVALAWNDAWAEYKKGSTGGAVAATVAALGSTILAASTTLGGVVEMNTLGAKGFQGARATQLARFGQAKVPLTSNLQASRVGAGSWYGIVLMVVGGLLMYYFARTPLEEFLARGPFGKEKNNRCKGSKTFESWQDDTIAEATLFNILFSPRLEPKLQSIGFRQTGVEYKIHLPLLLEGKTRVDYTLYGNAPMGLRKTTEKQPIPPSQEGTLKANEDGSYTLTIIYEPDMLAFASFEARALVDLYGDGRQVLPSKIDNGAITGHDPVVIEFPEVVRL